jgi:hypothetical protein
MKPLLATLLASAAGLLAWSGARNANVPYAFGAQALRESLHATASALQRGMARPQDASHAASSAASNAMAFGAARGAPADPTQRAAMQAASTPTGRASDAPKEVPRPKVSPLGGRGDALVDESPRERLAHQREPLSPEAQKDPISVQSWQPPPPPPPPAPVAKAPEAPPPVAPTLPFSFVGTLNQDQGKTQVFLANGDQLLIVSPGDVIDGRYRLDSIAATGAVFTYLPLNERQELTIEERGN